jgi:hypothetical protein
MHQTRRDINTISKCTMGIIGACILAVALYVYFLNLSVVHVVLQKETMRSIQDTKNEIAVLESEFIKAQHTIAARMATLDGLNAERNKTFVSRNQETGLVLNQ